MPEVNYCPEDGHFIDTNVVFDIVYKGRKRHKEAIDFYKKFKNLQLSIEFAVHAECNKVVLQYAEKFILEFGNFLTTLKREGRDWDRARVKNRLNDLTDFLKGVEKRKSGTETDFAPFFLEIIKEVRPELIRLSHDDVKQFLLLLPSKLTGRLKDQIEARFTMYIPYWDLMDEDLIKFRESVKNGIRPLFSNGSLKNDLEILLNIVVILHYGGSNDESFQAINFYTKDESFYEVCKKLVDLPLTLNKEEHSLVFNNTLKSLRVQIPY